MFRGSMAAVQVPNLTFNNGHKMPVIGLGTWKSKPGEVGKAVQDAIDAGYRHVDCAYIYRNEAEVGQGIRTRIEQKAIGRQDLFITSKLWNTFHRPDLVIPACKESIRLLGVDYLDLYLIHWPFAFQEEGELIPEDRQGNVALSAVDFLDTWRQMERCVQTGLTRSIGLANFSSQQVDRVLEQATIKPAVLQVECNPYMTQQKLVEFCRSRGLVVTGYSPMGSPDSPYFKEGTPRLLDDPELHQVAQETGRSVGQVILRYLVQRGVSIIPKSVNKSRIRENIGLFDFELSPADMQRVDALNRDLRICHRDHAKAHKFYPFNAEF